MSVKMTAAILATTLLATAAIAAPQRAPGGGAQAPGAMNGAAPDSFRRDTRDFDDNRRDTSRVEAQIAADPERAQLAERVSALVQAGKCAEARTMANQAGDRTMALRVRQTCRPH